MTARIVSIGAAVQDVFLSHSDEFKPVSDRAAHEQFMQVAVHKKSPRR